MAKPKKVPAWRVEGLERIADELRLAVKIKRPWTQGFVGPQAMLLAAEVLDMTARQKDASKLFNWLANSNSRDETVWAILEWSNHAECTSWSNAIGRVSEANLHAKRKPTDVGEIRKYWNSYIDEECDGTTPIFPRRKKANHSVL